MILEKSHKFFCPKCKTYWFGKDWTRAKQPKKLVCVQCETKHKILK